MLRGGFKPPIGGTGLYEALFGLMLIVSVVLFGLFATDTIHVPTDNSKLIATSVTGAIALLMLFSLVVLWRAPSNKVSGLSRETITKLFIILFLAFLTVFLLFLTDVMPTSSSSTKIAALALTAAPATVSLVYLLWAAWPQQPPRVVYDMD